MGVFKKLKLKAILKVKVIFLQMINYYKLKVSFEEKFSLHS